MPSADELAWQRARELACEDELRRLREQDRGDICAAAAAAPVPLAHSDSSGSEPDALVAGVSALNVPRAAPAPAAAALCAALAPHLPPPAPALFHLVRAAKPAAVAALLHELVNSVTATLATEPGKWPDEELVCVGALLSAALLARETSGRRRVARLLHALLDHCASAAQADALARLWLAALPEPRARLRLADALRTGAGLSDRLAAALSSAALLHLLEPRAQLSGLSGACQREAVTRLADAAPAWRHLPEQERYACVQLAGRVLAASDAGADADADADADRARLLAHLAPPAAAAAAAADHQRVDRLKVLVGASKLNLLFRTA